MLADFATERRVMAAFLAHPERFACFDTLAYQDFQDFRMRSLFAVIRRLQANEFTVTTTSVLDEIWRADEEHDTQISAHCGAPFLGALLLDEADYSNGGLCVAHDVTWLQTLSARRQGLSMGAAA